MKNRIIWTLVLLLSSSLIFSQTIKPEKITKAIYADKSKALRDIEPIPVGKIKRTWKDNVIPNKFNIFKETLTDKAMIGPDPILQDHMSGERNEPTINENFSGIFNTYSVAPPDTQGDVGLDHYFQMVNSGFAIWDKNGTKLYGPADLSTLWDGFDGPWSGTNNGDPIVLYDEYADRWIASQFSLPYGSGSPPYYELVAVSATGDPLSEWYRYAFEFDRMPDYPKFGVWHNAYCFTTNQFSNGSSWYGGGICVLDRDAMLIGDPDAEMVFFNMGSSYFSMLPADADGTLPPPDDSPIYLVKLSSTSLRLIEVVVDWEDSNNNSATFVDNLSVPSYSDNNISISQKGTSQKLDDLSDRLMYRLQYRNFGDYEVMLTNHSVNTGSGRAGVRWYELRDEGSGWYIYQQGTYGPADGTNRWMGSIAMNANGDIAAGYSISSSSIYPSIAVSGQTASSSGSGEFDVTETVVKTGLASQTGVSRWGDYSMMSVDPSDDQTFWFTTEYTNGGWNWRTQITSFGYVQEPISDFTANETLIPVGQTINFTDKTSGIPTEWMWTFEGGTPGTSTEKNPENIQYDAEGTFNVTLTATNELGSNTIVKEDYITVSSTLLPEIEFTADKVIFCTGEIVTFTDNTLYSPIQWLWEFNPPNVTFINGTDATSQNPQIEFNEAANYDVTLTSWNLNGESSLTKTEYVKAGGFTTFFEERFEENGFKGNSWTVENPDNDITWEIYEVGGTEPGTHAAGINFSEYPAVGEKDRLISPPINLEGLSSASLNFEHAYAKRLLQVTDSLIIYVSDDCGVSWTRVLSLGEDGNGSFATHEWTEDFWASDASDWCLAGWGIGCYEVDLSPWAGSANIQIAFETYSYYGNPLFIDNIKISQYVGIETINSGFDDMQVYPNPNTGRFTVVIPDDQLFEELVIYNQVGQIVYKSKLSNQERTIDVLVDSEWSNGVYLIKLLNSDNQIITKKVVVNK